MDSGEFRRTHPGRATSDEEPEIEPGPQLDEQVINDILAYCAPLLSDNDLQVLSQFLLQQSAIAVTDQPQPFPGRPTREGRRIMP
jgi:hypothetical protein